MYSTVKMKCFSYNCGSVILKCFPFPCWCQWFIYYLADISFCDVCVKARWKLISLEMYYIFENFKDTWINIHLHWLFSCIAQVSVQGNIVASVCSIGYCSAGNNFKIRSQSDFCFRKFEYLGWKFVTLLYDISVKFLELYDPFELYICEEGGTKVKFW